jgi:quinol monooxygenase YgiN
LIPGGTVQLNTQRYIHNLDDSTNLVFYELWDSREHYQKYLNWRTERGDFENLSSKLASPASIRYYDRIDV